MSKFSFDLGNILATLLFTRKSSPFFHADLGALRAGPCHHVSYVRFGECARSVCRLRAFIEVFFLEVLISPNTFEGC